MQGLKIQCPVCRRKDFITTEKYDPNVTPNGSMVKCLLPYHIDWLTTSTTKAAEMTCPECLAQLSPSGRLIIVEEKKTLVEVEEEMEKQFAEMDSKDTLKVQVNTLGIVPRGDQMHVDGDSILIVKEGNITSNAEAPTWKNDDGSRGIEEGVKLVNEVIDKTIFTLNKIPNVGKPAFICEICGKECSTALALNGHSRSHKKESK